MDIQSSLLMTGGEVAKELKISRALAYRWMQQGLLPTVRVRGGRTVRVPRQALLDWVRLQTHQPAGAD
jgi:excisionase family DNA binding protein